MSVLFVCFVLFSTTQGTLKKINGRSRIHIEVTDFADLKKSRQRSGKSAELVQYLCLDQIQCKHPRGNRNCPTLPHTARHKKSIPLMKGTSRKWKYSTGKHLIKAQLQKILLLESINTLQFYVYIYFSGSSNELFFVLETPKKLMKHFLTL